MRKGIAALITSTALLLPATAQSQAAATQPGPTFAAFLKAQYQTFKRNIVGSAEKMPEQHFAFEPAPEVRNWGELLGHVVLGNYLFCAEAKGEPNPKQGVNFEEIRTKAEMVQVMKESVAYCDDVFASLDDNTAMALIKVAGPNNTQREVPRANRLSFLLIHGNEHYGNMVTYMRLKGYCAAVEHARRILIIETGAASGRSRLTVAPAPS